MGLTAVSILWRRLDQAGHDSARLRDGPSSGVILEGTAVFSEAGQPCRLDYRVVCDAGWRTISARVAGWLQARVIDVEVTVDSSRAWTLNGKRCVAVHGCDDVDLSFTPSTNLLPIRRTRLTVGSRATVRAAWLRFPELSLEPLDQTYERLSESQYRYESNQGSFVAFLDTNDAGFITYYPGLWQIEPNR